MHLRCRRTAAAIDQGVSYADYLRLEATGDAKHEWLDGVVYAVAGGTLEHSGLAASVITLLTIALRGRPCRVFTSDARVRVRATGLGTWPDASFACGCIEHDPDDADALANPLVLVEVLSDSTEDWDRGGKFAHYRRIPSLRDYVLVGQHAPRVEHHYRNADGTWTTRDLGPGEVLKLTGVEAEIAVDEIYRDPMAG